MAADYDTKVYTEVGGSKLVVADGGEIEIQSGGTLDVHDGATFNAIVDVLTITDTLTIGTDGAGHDVIFYGDTAGSYFLYDADTCLLHLIGPASLFRLGDWANTAGDGVALSNTNITALRVYADDGGTAITTANQKALGSRFLITVSPGDCTLEGILGQIKYAENVHCSADYQSGIRGYLELVGGNTVNTGGANANIGAGASAVRALVDVDANTTIATNHYLCGYQAQLRVKASYSVTQNGVLCAYGVFADDQAGGAAPTDKWGHGFFIPSGVVDTGISIGAATTAGINIYGATEDGIIIGGACGDNGIEISGTCTDAAIDIQGTQTAAGVLISGTCGSDGIMISGQCTAKALHVTGAFTTGISLAADGTTGLEITSAFVDGTDMILLSGTGATGINIAGTTTNALLIAGATTDAIKITGTPSGSDIVLQNSGTINDGATVTGGSGDVLAITQDAIQLTGKVEVGSAWGTDGAGAIDVTTAGAGWDWAFQANAVLQDNLAGTAVAGAYHSLAVAVTQTGSTSVFGTWTDLVFSNSVDFSAADNAAAIWAQFEAGTSFTVPATLGDFATAIYANVKLGATFTTGTNAVVNGVRVQSEVSDSPASHGGRLAAFECLTRSGSYQEWDYGVYLNDYVTGIYFAETGAETEHLIDVVDTYLGLVIETGSYGNTGGVTLSTTNTRPVSFLFNDAGANIGGGADVRATLSRIALSTDQSGSSITALRGQCKLVSDADFDGYHLVGVEGYIELAGDNDVSLETDGSAVACVRGRLEVMDSMTHLTADTYMTAFFADLKVYTGKAIDQTSGVLAGLVIDASNTTGDPTPVDAWGHGVYIGADATDCGITINACTNDGILISGDVGDNAIEITGVATGAGILIDYTIAATATRALYIDVDTSISGGNNATCVEIDYTNTGTGINNFRALQVDATLAYSCAGPYAAKLTVDCGSSQVTGTAAALGTEVNMMNASTSSGAFHCITCDFECPASFECTSGPVSFMKYEIWGQTTPKDSFDDNAYLFWVTGLTPGADNLVSVDSQTMKVRMEALTRYMVLSQAQNILKLGAFSSTTAGEGVELDNTTVRRAFEIYADDGGTFLHNAQLGRMRMLITASTVGEVNALLAQLKYVDTTCNGYSGGILATFEGDTAINITGGNTSALYARVGFGSMSPAISSGCNICAVNAQSNMTQACTGDGETVAVLASMAALATQVWDVGFSVQGGATTTGINIGDCDVGISAGMTTPIQWPGTSEWIGIQLENLDTSPGNSGVYMSLTNDATITEGDQILMELKNDLASGTNLACTYMSTIRARVSFRGNNAMSAGHVQPIYAEFTTGSGCTWTGGDIRVAFFYARAQSDPGARMDIMRLENNSTTHTYCNSFINFVGDASYLFNVATIGTSANLTESGTSGNRDGWLKLTVGGSDRWIHLYDAAN